MSFFTYTYRDARGAISNGEIDCSSRAEAFTLLRARGITPIGLTEGRSRNANKGGRRGFKIAIVALGCVVLVGVSICCLRLFFSQEKETNVEIPAKAVIPSNQRQVPVHRKASASIEEVSVPAPLPRSETNSPPAKKKVQSNSELLKRDPNARVIPHRPDPRANRFPHASENLIAAMLETVPGMPVVGEIPFEKFEEDFKAALNNRIAVSPEDSDYDKALKQGVIDAKNEIFERIKKGESFAAVMRDQRRQLRELATYRMEMQAQLNDLRKKEDFTPEEYKKIVDSANSLLAEKGAEPIKLPRSVARQLQLQEIKKGSRK